MRVGILSQWFPPETGPASIPGVLARELGDRGHDVTVLTGYPNYPTGVLYDGFSMKARDDDREHGYAIRRVALYPDHSNRISGRLLNYVSFATTASAIGVSALKGIDVLWVYNSPATVALPMWLAKTRFRVPVVLHNMDMWPDSVIHTGFAPKRGGTIAIRALDAWVNSMYRSATFVAFISPSAGRELARRGVPAERLHYAPIWVDESVYQPFDGADLRRQLGYSETDIVVGYAGALGQAQCVLDLVRAVVSMPAKSRVKCLILGSGTQAEEIVTLAQSRPDRLKYVGQVDHAQMTEYSAVPDISFVGLSAGGEAAFATPSKVPAIMACGKPILAAASGDTATLVKEGGVGYVVRPGDIRGLTRALAEIEGQGRTALDGLGLKSLEYSRRQFSLRAGIDTLENLLTLAQGRKDTASPASDPPFRGR